MSVEAEIQRHQEILRQVIADPNMHPEGTYATISRPEYFRVIGGKPVPVRERKKLHETWIAEIIDEAAQHGAIGAERKAIVMAGPPGAGKGTIQRTHLNDVPGYVQCDPDAFKEKIISHELRTGKLDALKTPMIHDLEAQGHKFAPMELAALVHEESSFLSKGLQSELQRREMNFVIDTVLKSETSAQRVAAVLDEQRYTYDVISVQTSAAISKDGIYTRWAREYEKFLNGEATLGGRPVPSEFAYSVFPDPNGPSTTEAAARWLAENGRGAQSLQQFRRVEGQPHTQELNLVKKDGKLLDVEPKSEATLDEATLDMSYLKLTSHKGTSRGLASKPFGTAPAEPPQHSREREL